jgi:hypothetical protein
MVVNIFKQHIELLTTKFNESIYAWNKTSIFIGLSVLCYLVPIFLIKDTNIWTTILKLIFFFQTIFGFLSDYLIPFIQLKTGGRKPTIIHGIDRLLVFILIITIIAITLVYLNFKYIILIIIPLYFIYKSKEASNKKDWDKYIINHILWHITGLLIICFILYKIQLKHKLFE